MRRARSRNLPGVRRMPGVPHRASPRSSVRGGPRRIASSARPTPPSPSEAARTLPVPPGTTPREMPVPASAAAARRIVPSPPTATTSGGSTMRASVAAVAARSPSSMNGFDPVRARTARVDGRDDLGSTRWIVQPRRFGVHEDERRRRIVTVGHCNADATGRVPRQRDVAIWSRLRSAKRQTPRSEQGPDKLEECPCARHAVCPLGKVPGLFGCMGPAPAAPIRLPQVFLPCAHAGATTRSPSRPKRDVPAGRSSIDLAKNGRTSVHPGRTGCGSPIQPRTVNPGRRVHHDRGRSDHPHRPSPAR